MNLGIMLLQGPNKTASEGIPWLKQAADQGERVRDDVPLKMTPNPNPNPNMR